jgi:hypothetical protein
MMELAALYILIVVAIVEATIIKVISDKKTVLEAELRKEKKTVKELLNVMEEETKKLQDIYRRAKEPKKETADEDLSWAERMLEKGPDDYNRCF